MRSRTQGVAGRERTQCRSSALAAIGHRHDEVIPIDLKRVALLTEIVDDLVTGVELDGVQVRETSRLRIIRVVRDAVHVEDRKDVAVIFFDLECESTRRLITFDERVTKSDPLPDRQFIACIAFIEIGPDRTSRSTKRSSE